MGMPPSGLRAVRISGRTLWFGSGTRCTPRTRLARIAVPSMVAKVAPMQIRGPAPVARNDAQGTATPSKGTNGNDLAPAPATGASAAPPATGSAASADAGAKPQPPEFDIVRVERSGEGEIAGRGAPGATILLKDGDQELARAVLFDRAAFHDHRRRSRIED